MFVKPWFSRNSMVFIHKSSSCWTENGSRYPSISRFVSCSTARCPSGCECNRGDRGQLDFNVVRHECCGQVNFDAHFMDVPNWVDTQPSVSHCWWPAMCLENSKDKPPCEAQTEGLYHCKFLHTLPIPYFGWKPIKDVIPTKQLLAQHS